MTEVPVDDVFQVLTSTTNGQIQKRIHSVYTLQVVIRVYIRGLPRQYIFEYLFLNHQDYT